MTTLQRRFKTETLIKQKELLRTNASRRCSIPAYFFQRREKRVGLWDHHAACLWHPLNFWTKRSIFTKFGMYVMPLYVIKIYVRKVSDFGLSNVFVRLCQPGLRPGQSMWDLWWTRWHCNRLFSEFFGFPLSISFHRGSPYSNITVALHTQISSVGRTIGPLLAEVRAIV
jgi:hypothetical protein